MGIGKGVGNWEEEDGDWEEIESSQQMTNMEVARVTLNSVVGLPQTGMMKMKGVVNTQEVTILLDCGATHNFMCAKVVEALDLPTHAMQNYSVTLGNGSKIPGAKVCRDVPFMLSRVLIVQDFLPLE